MGADRSVGNEPQTRGGNTLIRRRSFAMALALAFSVAACSDSTGPTSSSLNAAGALQSLALLSDVSNSSGATFASAGFLTLGPFIDQVDVQIDGKTETMYALGLRQTFPVGSCQETVFLVVGEPPVPGECTSPDLELTLLVWQSHSSTAPPDRVLFIGSDAGIGTASFAPSTGTQRSAYAFYAEGQDKLWVSLSGTISSQITPTSQSCGFPLPPYAVTATCSIANFDENATISLEDFSSLTSTAPPITIVIPRQTLRGVWQTITQARPITVTR